MSISLEVFLAQCLLVFGLTTPGFAPYTGVYFALAAMVAGLLPLMSSLSGWRGVGAYRMLIAVIVLLLVPVPFHWVGPEDFYPLIVVLPVLIAPGAAALARRHPNLLSLETMCWALLAGAVGAVGLAMFESLVLGIVRAHGDNNPIHFGGIAAILGFGAMTGMFVVNGKWRFLFLLGPVLAAIAIAFSGSRGPAVGAIGLAVLAFLFLAWHWRKSRMIWVLLLAPPALCALLWIFLKDLEAFARIIQMIADAPQMVFDLSSVLYGDRVALVEGAIGAFMDAPIFGHGFSHMMQSILPHVDPEFASVANFDHLHSDLADFGVSGGIFGLLALAALLLSPFGAVPMYRNSRSQFGMLYLAAVLALGYLLLGLTNAVIGLLPQTTLFGVLLGFMVGAAPNLDTANQGEVA